MVTFRMLTLRLQSALDDKIDEAAAASGLSKSEIVRCALENYLESSADVRKNALQDRRLAELSEYTQAAVDRLILHTFDDKARQELLNETSKRMEMFHD
jgi:metal-responsive CopG/Arc/MetJ family transcriptional regulator